MYCPYCGVENLDTAIFCRKCGQEMIIPEVEVKRAQPRRFQQGVVIAIAGVLIASVSALVAFGIVGHTGFPFGDRQSSNVDPDTVSAESAVTGSESSNGNVAEDPSNDRADSSSSDPDAYVENSDSELALPSSEQAAVPAIDYSKQATAIAFSFFTNCVKDGGAMAWQGSNAAQFTAPDCDAATTEHLQKLASQSFKVIATDASLEENDVERRKFRLRVIFEMALDDSGANRQANIAELGLWLNEAGLVEKTTVDYL